MATRNPKPGFTFSPAPAKEALDYIRNKGWKVAKIPRGSFRNASNSPPRTMSRVAVWATTAGAASSLPEKRRSWFAFRTRPGFVSKPGLMPSGTRKISPVRLRTNRGFVRRLLRRGVLLYGELKE